MNRTDLHPYQQRMVQFIKDTPCCALLVDMGLGKTVTTLTAIADLLTDLEVCKVLVIAPKFVASTTWSDEVNHWDHLRWIRVSRIIGTEKQRIEALNKNADVYVMGRDSVVWLIKHYKGKIPFDMAVLDELTSFKHTTSQRFKAFKLVRSQFNRIVGLTGTPAPNGYLDLFGQMFCIDGGERLGKYITHYRNNYFHQIMARGGNYAIKCNLAPGSKEIIDKKISEIAMVMKAEDYLTLPERSDIIVRVELPEPIMKRYREFERNLVMKAANSGDVTASSAAALMNKLSQFCNGAVYNDEHDVVAIHDCKLEALKELYEQAGEHILVFYKYQHDHTRIWEAFGKNKKGGPVCHLFQNRQDLYMWNEGEIDILMAHPASTAYGLNMQAGGHVVAWFGVGWDLEQYQQANARLYRQGQQKPVRIYHLICAGTVEERALAALQGKASSQDAMMNAVKELMKKYGKD